jgi:hypothetical protein
MLERVANRWMGLAACGGVVYLMAAMLSAAPTQTATTPVSFNRQIRPILSNNCFACHGPDEKQRETKFHFDTKEAAFLEEGVIIPGNATKSKLVWRITNPDPEKVMPPPDSGHVLTPAQIDLLRRWIDEGAKWDTHWAYTAPVRAEPPEVRRREWPRNEIDRFVLARLEQESLEPSAEADKVTLLRRVTYDLTGLPPTPAEVDAFVADKAPDAYERRVDALLQSPRYGERMALPWLDAARYADTHGYHIDSLRGMWPWRDWVIGAFNRNLPFDAFIVEQIAGDLLPGATREQKIASGFNRNHMINFEGGAIADEYQVEYVVDRVEATSSAFMGLTMGCARCHSHKYDPISHKEFYQFYAFFNNVPEKGLDGRTGNAAPTLLLSTPVQQQLLDDMDAEIEKREEALDDEIVAPLQREWEQTIASVPLPLETEALAAHYDLDGSFIDASGKYRHGRTTAGEPTFDGGVIGRGATFDGDTEVSFGNLARFERSDPFTLAFWVRGGGSQPMTVLHKLEGKQHGYAVGFDDVMLFDIQRWAARLTFTVGSDSPAGAIRLRTLERLHYGDWYHVTVTSNGSGNAAGFTIYLNGRRAAVEVVQNDLGASTAVAAPLRVGGRAFGPPFVGRLDDLRVYTRALSSSQIEQLARHYRAQMILAGITGKRTKDEAADLRTYFLTYAASAPMKQAYLELRDLRLRRAALEKQIPTAMVMGELKKKRETFILARGDYRNQTEKVEAGVPAMLPPLPAAAPRNRLTLARWLVQADHPLTARVAVNRFWQMYFGTGLVKTQEDFGVQGEPPSHPELLDWLATEFVRSGWDVRAMQRLMVTSATYRQSSAQSSAMARTLAERDPENRLLWRGPRFRLPAEMIRDTALYAAGLLNEEIGGPSVLPYQPKGLWEEMAFGDGFSAQSYEQSHGKDLYRRGMYTMWKRTVPPASLATFDAPDREKCTARRALTNTPLQALTLLNDPTYVEAARGLAERALREPMPDDGKRIALAFRLATARMPGRSETGVLRDLLRAQRQLYGADRQAARKLVAVGESKHDDRFDVAELAAWTTVASTILNLDETITKQ